MKWNRFKYGIVLYVLVATYFFLAVLLNRRGYGDGWILDGIVVPTVIFVFSSIVVEIYVKDIRKLVMVVAFFIVAINLVPGLKYSLFYGVYDAPAHYRFAEQIAVQGYVPKGEFYSGTYGGNPGMHILMASFSVVSGFPFDYVFKFFVPFLFGLTPFFTYLIARKILDDIALRYAIIASGFPVIFAYVVYGTVLTFMPYFFLIAIFLRLILAKTRRRAFFLLFAVSSFTLMISHAVTPFFVSLILVGGGVIFWILWVSRKVATGSGRIIFLGIPLLLYWVLLWTWWSTMATINLNFLVDLIKSLWLPKAPAVPTRFYQIPLLSRLQILFVLDSAFATIAVLGLIGFFILIRQMRKKTLSSEASAFYLCVLSLLSAEVLFLFFQFGSNFGTLSYDRFVTYSIPFCSFLVGIPLTRLDKLRVSASFIRRLVFTFFVFVLVSICLFQFFPFQPLVPRADVLSKSLPESAYIVDLTEVNTVYQREMIIFAENHSGQDTVVSDTVTRSQLYGFSIPSFFSRFEYISILIPVSGAALKWDLIMLHTGRGGPFIEKVEFRTENIIQHIHYAEGSIIYDNSESFIVFHSR